MSTQIVSLDQNVVRAEIEKQISQVATINHPYVHDHKLLALIDSVTDPTSKSELLHKCLNAINENNAAFRAEIESRLKINEKITEHEIAKDQRRSELFNSRILILFAWIFPIAAGFFSIKFLDSYAFATFIIIVLYGMLIALYFSQSDGLAKTWKALTEKKRRDL